MKKRRRKEEGREKHAGNLKGRKYEKGMRNGRTIEEKGETRTEGDRK